MTKKMLLIGLLALIALAACGGAAVDQAEDAIEVTVYKSPT